MKSELYKDLEAMADNFKMLEYTPDKRLGECSDDYVAGWQSAFKLAKKYLTRVMELELSRSGG